MAEMHLHIISFDVPYPANYGGVIDVFHKIRSLHTAGVKVHLHCFLYNREPAEELEKYCFSVHYYTRKTGALSAIWWKPYIVFSRRSADMLKILCNDDYPILFEGLHSCYYLGHPKLRNRMKIYRESNIEHHYYYHLFKAEENLLRKFFFFFSSLKLRYYQRTLRYANQMLTVSIDDNAYLSSVFKNHKVNYLPSFHADDTLSAKAGSGHYCLYQANLSVPENIRAAEFLIEQIFDGFPHRLVIAGLNPPKKLQFACKAHRHITLVPNPSQQEMTELIQEAHINIMVTFQPTGLKLKLLNALYNGRYCLVNPDMVAGTELTPVCEIATSPKRFRRAIAALMQKDFTTETLAKRVEVMERFHSNEKNCKQLLKYIFE